MVRWEWGSSPGCEGAERWEEAAGEVVPACWGAGKGSRGGSVSCSHAWALRLVMEITPATCND